MALSGIERKSVPIPDAVPPPSCSIRNTSPFSAGPGEGHDCGTAGVYALWLPGTGKSWSVMKVLSRFVATFACSLVAASISGSANAQARANAPSYFSTPFGVIYKITGRETVSFPAKHATGTIIVSTKERYLYYVLGGGQALRYNIGVGREGRAFSGTSTVSAKREWPDWSPTPSIRKEQPNLPAVMKGGADNPMGARALYLGDTMFRIHGTNEPWRLGDAISHGCIRLSNDDIVDLYNRTKIGATVIVLR
jgi:lipoprotein-anchoring transpeptidase ErfK/SrfK